MRSFINDLQRVWPAVLIPLLSPFFFGLLVAIPDYAARHVPTPAYLEHQSKVTDGEKRIRQFQQRINAIESDPRWKAVPIDSNKLNRVKQLELQIQSDWQLDAGESKKWLLDAIHDNEREKKSLEFQITHPWTMDEEWTTLSSQLDRLKQDVPWIAGQLQYVPQFMNHRNVVFIAPVCGAAFAIASLLCFLLFDVIIVYRFNPSWVSLQTLGIFGSARAFALLALLSTCIGWLPSNFLFQSLLQCLSALFVHVGILVNGTAFAIRAHFEEIDRQAQARYDEEQRQARLRHEEAARRSAEEQRLWKLDAERQGLFLKMKLDMTELILANSVPFEGTRWTLDAIKIKFDWWQEQRKSIWTDDAWREVQEDYAHVWWEINFAAGSETVIKYFAKVRPVLGPLADSIDVCALLQDVYDNRRANQITAAEAERECSRILEMIKRLFNEKLPSWEESLERQQIDMLFQNLSVPSDDVDINTDDDIDVEEPEQEDRHDSKPDILRLEHNHRDTGTI